MMCDIAVTMLINRTHKMLNVCKTFICWISFQGVIESVIITRPTVHDTNMNSISMQ